MNAAADLHTEHARPSLGSVADALVMMVDDEPAVIEVTHAFLEDAGYRRFVPTTDSTEAIALLLRERPHVLLLDLNMPKVTGFDILAQMQADKVLKHIPVIVMTSEDEAQIKLKALQLGAMDFLSKPVDPSELALRLRNTLARRELEARRLAEEVRRKETIRRAFSRYVSPRLAEGIMNDAGNDAAPFPSQAQRADVVALFADLRGFTRITETVGVESAVQMLNEYFSVLTEAAYQHEGTIFNMAGDSLLVGFNVPFPQPDSQARAWRTTMDMISRFAPVATAWRARHGIATGVGIGICRGEAIFGNIGSPHFMSYTVIGDTVNTAARLMQMAQVNEVLVSGDFYEAIRALVPAGRAASCGDVALRGKAEAIPVYSIRL